MRGSLTEIAQQLRDANNKIQLIYVFNGTVKTRLPSEFKKLIAPKTHNELVAEPIEVEKKIIHFLLENLIKNYHFWQETAIND